jgi:3-methyladenine DNA glycosylase AlkC
MADALKDQLDQAWWLQWFELVQQAFPSHDFQSMQTAFDAELWQRLTLKQRIKHAAEQLVLHSESQMDYAQLINGLIQIAPKMSGLPGLVLPQIVEDCGLDEVDVSFRALEVFTCYSTGEFAIRPFIERDPERTMSQMQAWSLHENHHLRRLASEGCRPRLPWASPLRSLQQDPEPIWPILHNLMQDDSLYVRKSVANNLNDIGKDHPQAMLDFCRQWAGRSEQADWIIKHASRNFLKQRHPDFLALIGIEPSHVEIENWRHTATVKIGENLEYGFDLTGGQAPLGKLRVELQVEFPRTQGRTYQKVFKLIEGDYRESRKRIDKTLAIKPLSTRKIYPGRHGLKLIVNGEIKYQAWFEVMA